MNPGRRDEQPAIAALDFQGKRFSEPKNSSFRDLEVLHREHFPSLTLCPSRLGYSPVRELHRTCGGTVEKGQPESALKNPVVVLTSAREFDRNFRVGRTSHG